MAKLNVNGKHDSIRHLWVKQEISRSKGGDHHQRGNNSALGCGSPHTDARYYIECFSLMYSPSFIGIPSGNHCLKRLQFAGQIRYQEFLEACTS
jgi:hypothetical protein